MSAARERLPHRRPLLVRTVEQADGISGITYTLSVGFYADGRAGEVFCSGAKPGSALDHISADAATLISVALQHGVPIDAMRKSLARLPDGTPATIVGHMVEVVNEAVP